MYQINQKHFVNVKSYSFICQVSKKNVSIVVRTIKWARLVMTFVFSRILGCFLQRILLLLSTDVILRLRELIVKNAPSRIKTKTNQRENFKTLSNRIKNSSKIVKNFFKEFNKLSHGPRKYSSAISKRSHNGRRR